MVIRRWKSLSIAALSLLSLGVGLMPGTSGAQTSARPAQSLEPDPVEQALVTTLNTGRPTILAVTSAGNPESRRVWSAMLQSSQARQLTSTAQLLELVAEENLARTRQLGITTTPTLCVIRRGQNGLEKAAQQAMPRDLGGLLTWVNWAAGVNAQASTPAIDPALTRTNHHGYAQAQPSPQAQQAPPQMAPPQAPPQMAPPQMAPPQMLQSVPVVNAPSPPPVAVTMAAPPVYVQQSAPTVVLGPTPPPNVVIAQAAPSLPTITMAAPSAPSPPQMMLSPAPQPQPQPMMAFAQPQPQPMMAFPQPQPAAAPVAQQSIVGTAALGLILSNPNLLDRILGAIGRLLSQRGLPRLQMNPGTPATFAPALVPAGQAGVLAMPQPQQLNAVPAVPQQLYYVPPPSQAPPPTGPVPSPQQPVGVTPSPQGGGYITVPHHHQNASSSRLFRWFHQD